MESKIKTIATIGFFSLFLAVGSALLSHCGGGGSGGGITTEDENLAANAIADSTQAALAGAMDAYATANNLMVFSKHVGSNPGSASFPCTVAFVLNDPNNPSAGGVNTVTCQCNNFDANNPGTGIATIKLTTTEETVTDCNGGPLKQNHTEQNFTLTFTNCSISTCNSGATVTSQGGSDITGHITYDTNQCLPIASNNPRRVATIDSGICTSTTVTPTGASVAVSAGPTNLSVSSGGAVSLPTNSSSGSVCANERAFFFDSLDDLATNTACGPGGNCLDISGNWTQSYVCYNKDTKFCERNDNSEFVISQPSCTQVESDVLDVWTATEVNLTGPTGTVKWTATEDVNPEGSDSGEDYSESGTWTFQNADNLTSGSTFKLNQSNFGGPCMANAKKDGPPARITEAECLQICDGAANKNQVCP